MMEPVDEVPPPVPKAPPPAGDLEERRKSLGLLREISTTWSAEPNPTPHAKYTLSEEEGACGGGAIDVVAIEKERGKEKEEEKEKEESVNDVRPAPALKPPHNPPPRMSTMEEEVIRDRLRLTLLRECAVILDAEPRYTRDTFRRAFLNKELLSKLFQLFDQDRDGQLDQEDWIEFLKERLIGEKQIDLAEQLESVAYVLCGEDTISLDRFCQLFQAKGSTLTALGLHRAEECLGHYFLGFLMNQGFPLKKRINELISLTMQSGLTLYWNKIEVRRNWDDPDASKLRVLSLWDLRLAFYVLVSGYAISVAAFLCELVYARRPVVVFHNRQINNQIQKAPDGRQVAFTNGYFLN